MKWKNHRRILALHEHLRQLEAGRLARLEALARNLKEEETQLIRALEGNEGLVAIFPDLVLNRLRTTMERSQGAAHAVEMQAKLALEQAKRAKQAEKLLAGSERDRDRELAQKELSELVDSLSNTTNVSAP